MSCSSVKHLQNVKQKYNQQNNNAITHRSGLTYELKQRKLKGGNNFF